MSDQSAPDPPPEPDMAPGDETSPDTEAAGEDMCPACGGSGRADDGDCPTCGGTGTVMRGIGGG